MRLLLQFPEGLKKHALEYARRYESEGHEVFLSGSPCYGACDLALEEARAAGADRIIHFGHAKFIRKSLPIEIEYIEFHLDANLGKFREAISKIRENSIALATTVQHIHQINEMKSIAEGFGKKVFVGKGMHAFHPGQVLGCDAAAISSVIEKADAVVFVGDGNFHALAISDKKPVYAVHPESGSLRSINAELKKLKKKRLGSILAALDARRFGILVSSKPGQRNPALAKAMKKRLQKAGLEAQIIVSNEFSGLALNNFMSFDCYIVTACPRIADDSEAFGKPMLDPGMFAEMMKMKKELKG